MDQKISPRPSRADNRRLFAQLGHYRRTLYRQTMNRRGETASPTPVQKDNLNICRKHFRPASIHVGCGFPGTGGDTPIQALFRPDGSAMRFRWRKIYHLISTHKKQIRMRRGIFR
jgi:hypothetical protein